MVKEIQRTVVQYPIESHENYKVNILPLQNKDSKKSI